MTGLLATLPLHLACQLISHGNHEAMNVTLVEDAYLANQTVKIPAGYTIFPDVGVAYKFYKNKLTWNAARKQCISEGASLAIIDSFKKVEYVAAVKDKTLGVHTGIHRLYDSTAEWNDIRTGLPVSFVPWKPDANLATTTGLWCTALWSDGSGVGPWNCMNVLASVCEIPLYRTVKSSEAQAQQSTSDALYLN
ncbi:lymphocyte antigen 75-like [Athalia rosae]|uniref:lymphocyte antigen 75-like n=1 Tax=Athalia rosae TaxID=37344 RepID=UPI000625F5E8|nr:lymphocyte antigen 75-like [Athalia rosae]